MAILSGGGGRPKTISGGGGPTSHYETWSLDSWLQSKLGAPTTTPTTTPQNTIPTGGGQTITPTVTQPTQSRSSEDYINDLAEAWIKARISSLNSQANANLNSLSMQAREIQPRYGEAKTGQDVQSMLLQKRMKDSLLAQGMAEGDISGQQISLAAANRGALGDLSTQEQAAYDAIENAKQQIRQALAADIAAAKNDAESNKLQQLIASQQYQDQLALQAAPYTGELYGQPTLQAQQLLKSVSSGGSDLNDIYKMLQIQQMENSMSQNPYMSDYQDSLERMFSINGVPVPYGSGGWTTAVSNAEAFINNLLRTGAVDQNGANILRSIYLY